MGGWYITSKQGISYMALVRTGYPDRFANSLVEELARVFSYQGPEVLKTCAPEAFTKVMGSEMSNLANKYEDLRKLDKVHDVNEQVQQVQSIANQGIQQVLRNTEQADVLAGKAAEMEGNARVFHTDAKRLERIMYWRKVKINCILIFVVVAVLAYILIPIIVNASD